MNHLTVLTLTASKYSSPKMIANARPYRNLRPDMIWLHDLTMQGLFRGDDTIFYNGDIN